LVKKKRLPKIYRAISLKKGLKCGPWPLSGLVSCDIIYSIYYLK
jgi:hypothetical protein